MTIIGTVCYMFWECKFYKKADALKYYLPSGAFYQCIRKCALKHHSSSSEFEWSKRNRALKLIYKVVYFINIWENVYYKISKLNIIIILFFINKIYIILSNH